MVYVLSFPLSAALTTLFHLRYEQKYDRQTRIWGAYGQETIETAHVCALNGTATTSETLKNIAGECSEGAFDRAVNVPDPENCWKSFDYTTAKSGKDDEIVRSVKKSFKDLEKWWDDSYDIVKHSSKIQTLVDEEKKEEERRKGTN